MFNWGPACRLSFCLNGDDSVKDISLLYASVLSVALIARCLLRDIDTNCNFRIRAFRPGTLIQRA